MVSVAEHLPVRPTSGPIPLGALPDRPRVSVLMANYNYARFVGEAIESVLAQSYRNLELIVCDDGSTDDSCDVIERYVRRDPRVTLLRKPNGGMASAWNAALPHASGDILCLLDADDVFRPGKLDAVVRTFRDRPASGLLVHAMTVITAVGDPILTVPFLTPFEEGWIAGRVLRRGGRWRYMPTSSLAFRRELCPYAFPLDERLFFRHAESLLLTLGPLVTEVAAIEEPLTGYRVHGGNRTGGHAHDAKTARRAVDNVSETIEGVNARLAALGLPHRLERARNLEYRQAQFILSLLAGARRRLLHDEFRALRDELWRDDLYGRAQKMLGLVVYGGAMLLPRGQRPWWLAQTLGYSRLKQRVRGLLGVLKPGRAGARASAGAPNRARHGASGDGEPAPPELLDVLALFDKGRSPGDWCCLKLGHGRQGHAWAVRAGGTTTNGGVTTGGRGVVVKMYEAKTWARGAMHDQHDVLRLLQKAVAGVTFGGWSVGSPVPLFLCDGPLALVMDEVSGVPLSRLLREPGALSDHGPAVAGALGEALGRFWTSSGRPYGELNLDNVLCDPSTRSLWLIDPGIARPHRLCLDDRGPWYPASHDLAYMVYAVAAKTVRVGLLRPGARERQLTMARLILGAACDRLARRPLDRNALLAEVEACTQIHLQRIGVSWSPKGIWRRFVRLTAARRVRRLIDEQRQPVFDATREVTVVDECPVPVSPH